MAAAAGRARAQHRHALGAVGRGDAAGRPGGECRRRAGRARPGRRRRDALPHRDGQRISGRGRHRGRARQRGRDRHAAGRAGRDARRRLGRRRELRRGSRARRRARSAASPRSPARSITSRTASAVYAVGERPSAARRWSPGPAACRRRSPPASSPSPDAARGGDRGARRLRRRGRGRRGRREGPGHLPRRPLRRALHARPRHARRSRRVSSREAARDRPGSRDRRAAGRGRRDRRPAAAQGRADGRGRRGRRGLSRELPATFVVNDDVEAAIALGADGVHLGRRTRASSGRSPPAAARALGLDGRGGGRRGERGAAYIGAGPVWATPSKDRRRPGDRAGRAGRDLRARSRFRWWRSAASMRRTPPTASAPARPGVAVIRAARDSSAIIEAIDAAL